MIDLRSLHRLARLDRINRLERLVVVAMPLALALGGLPGLAFAAGADASAPSSMGRTAAPRDTAAATDETIMADVKRSLATIQGVDPSSIDVRAVDGVVRLQGAIRDESLRATILKAAKDVRGVTAVSDELRVSAR